MKEVISYIISIVTSMLNTDYISYFPLQKSEDATISAFVGFNNYYDRYSNNWKMEDFPNSLIVVINENNKNDTIELYNFQDHLSCYGYNSNIRIDTFYFTPILLDKKYNKGILFTLKTNEIIVYGESATNYVEKTTKEIWDIKSKKRIFKSTSSYTQDENHFGLMNDTTYYDYHLESYYHQTFYFTKATIHVDEADTDFDLNNEEIYNCIEPVKSGIYKYQRKKFIKVK